MADSHDGVAREQSDAAQAGGHAGVALQTHVAGLAPPRPPRVLDDPVLPGPLVDGGVGLAVAHHGDAVVHLRGAGPREDAATVELPHEAPRVDGHRHGLRGGGPQQVRLAVGRHVPVPGDAHRGLVELGRLADAVDAQVRVAGLGGQAVVGHDELVGPAHEPAGAPHRLGVAVHQLLLRQRHQLPLLDVVQPLHGRHRRERPARAAAALVLHRHHRPFLPPVHLLGQSTIIIVSLFFRHCHCSRSAPAGSPRSA
uniref:Uncharacterized protein n=1 Tax=Triticum urartu TaxID=4572 RepID=A0A8R7UI23_TRIUA